MRKPRRKGYRMGTNLATGVGVKLWCLVMMFYLKAHRPRGIFIVQYCESSLLVKRH